MFFSLDPAAAEGEPAHALDQDVAFVRESSRD
jgi:hypothetical protein